MTEDKKDSEEEKGPAPIGNGGTTDKYTWTQTLTELEIVIPVEAEVKGKNVKIAIGVKHITVNINGDKYIDSDFPENINVDDSLWTIETEGNQKYI